MGAVDVDQDAEKHEPAHHEDGEDRTDEGGRARDRIAPAGYGVDLQGLVVHRHPLPRPCWPIGSAHENRALGPNVGPAIAIGRQRTVWL